MKKHEGVDVQIHVFLTSAPVRRSGRLHDPADLLPGKEPPAEWAPDQVWTNIQISCGYVKRSVRALFDSMRDWKGIQEKAREVNCTKPHIKNNETSR
jgi:hypothetical protein